MNRKNVRVHYNGRVQGVGFRYTVKTLAQGFEITGAVRNLPDGRVELEAEGAVAELEDFLRAVRESEVGSFIKGEHAEWREGTNKFRGFVIAG